MTDLVEQKKDDPAARFRAMSERITHNANEVFGGAVVIIPPANAGDPIELLMLDLQADPAQFWATIKTRIEIRLSELDERQRTNQAFGQRVR